MRGVNNSKLTSVHSYLPAHSSSANLALSPGSPLFNAIIPHVTFDQPERKAEGEPGIFWHVIYVTLRQFHKEYGGDTHEFVLTEIYGEITLKT